MQYTSQHIRMEFKYISKHVYVHTSARDADNLIQLLVRWYKIHGHATENTLFLMCCVSVRRNYYTHWHGNNVTKWYVWKQIKVVSSLGPDIAQCVN